MWDTTATLLGCSGDLVSRATVNYGGYGVWQSEYEVDLPSQRSITYPAQEEAPSSLDGGGLCMGAWTCRPIPSYRPLGAQLLGSSLPKLMGIWIWSL